MDHSPTDDKPGPGAEDTGDPISAGLAELRRGASGALDRLVPLIYDDLRRVARQRLRQERDGHTLGTTALVHDAYLRLSTQRQLRPSDRAEFFAAASNTMRRILVDYARGRNRLKRGTGEDPSPLDELEPLLSAPAISETLALDQALTRLEAVYPRAARVFEQRLFGGLSIDEISEVHDVSPKTVNRDWNAARAWLRKEVRRGLED